MSASRARLINLFVLVLLVYGALQVYVVMRLRGGLGLHALGTAVLAVWAAVMTVMPLVIRRWERGGRHRTALVGAWVGYTWMGVTFVFSWISGGPSRGAGSCGRDGAALSVPF